MARAKIFGDEHIKRLEQENKQLRDDYTRAREENVAKAKLEDLLDQLQGKRQQPEPTESNQPIRTEEKAIDYKQIESLIENKFKQAELTKTYNQNLESVKNKLIERFGPEYVQQYKQQIDQLNLTKEDADSMAGRNPVAFMKMLGIDQPKPIQQQYQPPVRNQTSTPQPIPSVSEKRDWAWYEDLRKKDRNKYLSKETQLQMLQDRMSMGESFNTSGFDVSLGGQR